jgi:hypothetical protein
MRARFLPVVLAVALTGILGTDVAVAVHVRAEDRKAAALAAEQRAVASYRAHVRPVAERVYDEVQPVQDAIESFQKPGTDVAQIAEDVFTHSGVAEALLARRTELARLAPPATLRAQRVRLLDALDILAAASKRLADTKIQADYSDFNAASSALGSGILAWSTSLTAVYADKNMPSRPVGGDTPLAKRPAASRATLVAALDGVCSAAADAGAGLPPIDNPRQLVQAGPRYTRLMRNTLKGMRAVAVPASQKARVTRDISPNYTRADKLPAGIDAIVAAIVTGNATSLRSAMSALATGMRGSQALSVSLRGYGATVCADFFEIPESVIKDATGESATAVSA